MSIDYMDWHKVIGPAPPEEEDGGVWLHDVEVGDVLYVQTKNTLYEIEKREDGYYISGNPKYCPKPTKAYISGSTWGGSMLKVDFVGRGMHLEFATEEHPGNITTSSILSIAELQ